MLFSMTAVIARRLEDAGHRPLDNRVMEFRVKSYVQHMTNLGIHPNEYETVYEVAMQIYNSQPNVGPFNVDHMIQAAKQLKAPKKVVQEVVYKKPDTKTLVSCSLCQGSKLAYRMDNGKIVGLDRDADGNIKKCEECSSDS
jgi:hypothetical protein